MLMGVPLPMHTHAPGCERGVNGCVDMGVNGVRGVLVLPLPCPSLINNLLLPSVILDYSPHHYSITLLLPGAITLAITLTPTTLTRI